MIDFLDAWRNRPLARGASWLRCTGPLMLALIAVELVTGLLLMTVYTPSVTDAWASVHYLQYSLTMGRVLRGLHYYGAHALLVVMAIHLLRLLVTASYRRPYGAVWLSGLALAGLMLLLAASGNPLPWGHKELGQIQVEMHIVGSMPGLGPALQRLIQGGSEIGQRTLSQLYALHVGVLPLVGGALLWFHLSLIIRAARKEADEGAAPVTTYFPEQTVRNAVVVLVVIAGLLYVAWRHEVPLGPPADPMLPSSPRPEWYFLALFELRRYFTGSLEFVATGIVPAVLLAWLAALPVIERCCGRKCSIWAGRLTAIVLAAAAGLLTWLPIRRDAHDAEHLAVVAELERVAKRAIELAHQGVPLEGPVGLLYRDPLTMGPRLFERHCASCHPYGEESPEEPKAANLARFGTEDWIWGLVQKPDSPEYFGHTKHREMAEWSRETLPGLEEDELEEIRLAVRWLASKPRGVPDEEDDSEFARGYEAFDAWCIECHPYEGDGGFNIQGPDFTGYGSAEWIADMIRNPKADHLYGDSAEMPSFEGKLTDLEIEVLARWLAGETDLVQEP